MPIDPVNSTTSNSTTQRTTSDVLGKDAFLRLMVEQLRHQDPLSPQDNNQWMAQMAQLTATEQITNLVQQMTAQAYHSAMSQGVSMIGHQISYSGIDAQGQPATLTGTVTAVRSQDGQVLLQVGDQTVALGDVQEVQ